MIPEISVQELAQKLSDGTSFVLLDVREPHELSYAKLKDEWVTLVPLSKLSRERLDALPDSVEDKEAEIVVMCHTGHRSAQVTMWLRQNGWKKVFNLAGGIDEYARRVDPSVGFY